MKNVSKKVRTGIIDRFFMSANELPHSISYDKQVDGWKIFICQSATNSMMIAYKETPFTQFIKWA